MTAFKKNVIACQENWRFSEPKIESSVLLEQIRDGKIRPQTSIFREAMMNHPDWGYDEILSYIRNVPMGAPWYAICSGENGANVITRDVQAGSFVEENITKSSESWMMVQTNYDRDKPDPTNDPRRTVAEDTLRNKIGETGSSSAIGLFATMSSNGVTVPSTSYTVVMN